MSVAVAHVMVNKVFFASLDHTVRQVRDLMQSKKIHAVPVVGKNRKVMGIITTADLARKLDDDAPARHVMSSMVATISATEPVSEAARIMREQHIHHLVVTDGPTAVGIVSSYDLLRLVEQKFAEPPTA